MKLEAGHVVFLLVGLVAGFGLCWMLQEARSPSSLPEVGGRNIASVSGKSEDIEETRAPDLTATPQKNDEATATTAGANPEKAPERAEPVKPKPRAVTPQRRIQTAQNAAAKTAQTPQSNDSADEQTSQMSTSGPKIHIETTDYDTGILPADDKSVRKIKVANNGDSTLNIKSVKSSCGCVSGSIEKKVIAPGGSTDLVVTIDPNRISGFKSTKTITLFSDDPDNPRVQVKVTARLEQTYEMEPQNIDFGTVEKGTPAEASILFRSLKSDPPVKVTDVSPYGRVRNVELDLEQTPEGQWRKPGHPEYKITAKLLPTVPPGNFIARARLRTQYKTPGFETFYVKANIKAFYEVSPTSVALHAPRGDGDEEAGSARRSAFTVTVKADRPFEIVNLESTDEHLLASARAGNDPNTRYIDLKLAPEATARPQYEKVTFGIKAGEEILNEQVYVRVLSTRRVAPRRR